MSITSARRVIGSAPSSPSSAFYSCWWQDSQLPLWATALYFYLGGVGVRERNFFAAVIVFFLYFLSTVLMLQMLFTMGGIVRIFICALLFSNMRATWLASQWKPESEEAALPPRFGETLGEKFADKLPQILWPKLRIFYFIFALGYLVLTVIGLGMLAAHRIVH